MLLSEFIESGVSALHFLYPAEESRNIMLLLCGDRLGTQRYTHIVEPSFEIPDSFSDRLEQDMIRLKAGEPIQYVIGKACFRGHDFEVDRRVLIPRPETEELVDLALDHIREGNRVLDLCTGSGCIAWSLALESKAGEIVGVDVSMDALEVASSQYSDKRVHFAFGNILETPQIQEYGSFDIVVSNPPYITENEKSVMRSNVLSYEPELALFVPDDDPLKFYRGVGEWSMQLLKEGGRCFAEINERFGRETLMLFKSFGFSDIQLINDIFGKNRFVVFQK